jgi:hypothetical protein
MDELAAAANCSNSTVRDFEHHRRQPHRNRLAAIQQALEKEGVVFSVAGARETISWLVKPPKAAEAEIKPPGRKGRPGGSKRKVKNRAA